MFTLTVWHMMGTPPTDPGEVVAALSFMSAHAWHISHSRHMQPVSELLSADLLCVCVSARSVAIDWAAHIAAPGQSLLRVLGHSGIGLPRTH